ncbi:MAG: TetR/AcrR family transcriptional regulator [Pigmentiphaga sp.]|nr:TetR/AcrR family transcriptional regulator [Pigmentiphaga sp.]
MTDASVASSPPRKRRAAKSAKHTDRLSVILRTAAGLFAEHGYEATSLDTVARHLGMHKATLYHYVKGKEDILYQSLTASFADLDTISERVKDRSLPVTERLRIFTRSLAAAQNNEFGRCHVLVGARPLNHNSERIRQFQRRLDNIVRDLVTEGIADGSLRDVQPGMVSAMLFGSLNWVPRWYKPEGAYSIEEIADSFCDFLISGIQRQPAS